MNFTGKGPCVTAPWDNKVDNMMSFNCDNLDTQEKRNKLWCVCNRPGREVGVLLLLQHHHIILFLVPENPSPSPPDRHITSLRHRGHHRLRLASRQQRLRQRGRGQHQGHSEGRSPGGGGHSGGKCLKNSCFKIQIYALLADGGEDAPEHKRMASLLWYTNYCAKTPDKKITHILSFSVTLFTLFLFSKVQS